VRADPPQLEYILHVLATNAREAMPGGGALTVATRRLVLDEAFVAGHPGARSGPHACIPVADTGAGMDETARARVFEPFATRTRGRGTGLELAAVYGMVKQHDGYIEIESARGRGSAFHIYLPLVERVPEAPRAERAAPPATPVVSPSGRAPMETVLLVEDDHGVRSLVRMVLEREGYTVLEASDAAAALAVVERRSEPIHLLLTDVMMPGMNGCELARVLTSDHPTLRVLFMSGYPGIVGEVPDLLAPDAAFVAKPFTPATLVARLRAVLDG
jgi:CheY-like chemotaxis protein